MNKNIFDYNLEQTANVLQILSFFMLVQQTSTDDIMKTLQKEEKLLQNDIISKLDIIIKQNEELLKK